VRGSPLSCETVGHSIMGFSQHSVCVSVGVQVCAWCMCVHGACVCMVHVCAWCVCLHGACVCTSMCAKEEYQHTICTLYAHYMHTIYSEVKQLSQNIDH